MDVDAVLHTSTQLKSQGEAIQHVITTVNQLVNQLPNIWKGKDAAEFEGWWNNQHRPALQHAADAIHGLGQSAYNNAQDQIAASGR
jgi:uncharacterized protein YukE